MRGLGTSLIKYVATAVVIMNYGRVFTTINQGFRKCRAIGLTELPARAASSELGKRSANPVQSSRISEDMGTYNRRSSWVARCDFNLSGLFAVPDRNCHLRVLLHFLREHFVHFRTDRSRTDAAWSHEPAREGLCREIFIWNAWPVLYGGFGALLTAVQMGQVGQMLNHNDFLGGLGNLEGSFLIGIVSIVYSLAIAIIPFIAKRIVSGDVGSTAVAMVGAAVTAITAGAAGIEGAGAGLAAARAGSGGASAAGASSGTLAGSARALTASGGGNLPAPAQPSPILASSRMRGAEFNPGAPTLEGHAELIRNSMSGAMGTHGADDASEVAISTPGEASGSSTTTGSTGGSRPHAPQRRGPTVHKYNVGTWGAYHAARIAVGTIARATKRSGNDESEG